MTFIASPATDADVLENIVAMATLWLKEHVVAGEQKTSPMVFWLKRAEEIIAATRDLEKSTQAACKGVAAVLASNEIAQFVEIETVMTLSTAHLDEESREWMEGQSSFSPTSPDEVGWWVYCAVLYGNEELLEYPETVKKCMVFARDHGCTWLKLDADGPILAELPYYSW